MARYRITGIVVAALLALPMAASAKASDQKPTYKQADANGDGVVTIKEAVKAGVPKSEAKREDIDNDGKLTKADWKFVDMDGKTGSSAASS